MNPPHAARRATEALEARFALRVCAKLNAGTDALPHDLSERLRVARLRAVECSRQSAAATETAPALLHSEWRTTLGLFGGRHGGSGAWWKFASVLPLVVLVLGVVMVRHFDEVERIDAAAEVDAALLSDDLPPQAYTDPGFAEFLSTNQSHNSVN